MATKLTLVLVPVQLLVCCTAMHSSATNGTTACPVWPEPRVWAIGGAGPLALPHRMAVRWAVGEAGSGVPTGSLERAIARFYGAAFPHLTAVRDASAMALRVVVREPQVALQLGVSEAYKLEIPAAARSRGAGANITLTADNQIGVFRGLETLAQLVVFNFSSGTYGIPQTPVQIDDSPRFPHREILMDSARHWLSVPTIKQLLGAMAINKFNTLHWHLVDLQSFPFIAPRAPELARDAAFSAQERYTTGDVRAVVAFAADLGIRVVVEVDVPGHTFSICRSHPEVCPTPACGAQNALSPNTNDTFDLVQKIFEDVADATIDQVIHLGGDEVQYSCWNNSVEIRKWIAEQPYGKNVDWSQGCTNVGTTWNGTAFVNDTTGTASCVFDNVFQDFILKSHQIAASLNRTATGWHEIWRHLGTRLPKSTIIHFWLGGGDGLFDMLDATSNGYRAVWSIARGVGLGSWYTGGDAESWDTMYMREPCEGLSEAQCSNVLGGGAEQCEYTLPALSHHRDDGNTMHRVTCTVDYRDCRLYALSLFRGRDG